MKVALLAIACLTFGCAGGPHRSGPVRSDPSRVDRGYQAVQWAADLEGSQVGRLPKNKRATLMVVFASWCGPCRRELALLGELRQLDPEVRIIGLNAYEEWGKRSDQDRLRKFLGQNAPWLRVVRADSDLLASFGGVSKVPTVFVYDGRGRLVREFRRARRAPPTLTELRAAVTAAKRS